MSGIAPRRPAFGPHWRGSFLATLAVLALTATSAQAHELPANGAGSPYCGFSDGDFLGPLFDRYMGTQIVTPGANPGAPGQWHAVFHEIAHFGPNGWEYTNLRFCRWGFW